MKRMMRAALKYAADFQWYVFPLIPRSKRPLIPEWPTKASIDPPTIRDWWLKNPGANIGIACGPSKLVVVDCDVKNEAINGLEAWLDLRQEYKIDDATVTQKTPSGGEHILYSSNGHGIHNSSGELAPGIDIRADGGYIVAPPSLTDAGEYAWEVTYHPTSTKLLPLPASLIALLAKKNIAQKAQPVPNAIYAGQRNAVLTSLAGTMRRRGMTESEISGALLIVNEDRCNPRLEATEIQHISMSVCRYEPAVLGMERVFNLTDLGNAERLAASHGQTLRYCHSWGKWLHWNGQRWEIDENDEVVRRASETVRSIQKEAALAVNEDIQDKILKWSKGSESRSRLTSLVQLAQAENVIGVGPDSLDRDPWLINARNGIVDLQTGALTEADPAQLITKLVPTQYNPEATCPMWIGFLNRIMDRNDGMITYLQRAVGYAMTGSTREQCLFILYGRGANGKALALDTPIPTPTGWATQGNLRPGDDVFDEKGKPCKVKALSPIWANRPCYRMTFSDGETIVADAQHEWPVRSRRGQFTVSRTTEEIAARIIDRERIHATRGTVVREYRWATPMAEALQLPEADLPLDPYLVGAWLGDGTTAASELTCHESEITEELERREIQCNPKKKAHTYRLADRAPWAAGNIQSQLRSMGLLNNKHIPLEYLRGSYQQRLDLLRGLMDTDGSTLKTQAQCEYTSTSKQLADGVAELLRTFGLRPAISEGRATLYGKDCGPKYRVIFTTTKDLRIFNISRKAGICRARRSRLVRKIIACEKISSVPVRCIEVDSDSHLYLSGRGFVPTHNSVFLETLSAMLNDYAMRTPTDTLLVKRTGGIPNDVARLKGARLVTAVEADAGNKMAESLVKQITGGEKITARFLHREWFEFQPQFKVFLATNHKPVIVGTDHAIWRRIQLIPFTVTIPADEQDKDLALKLQGELSGILTWAVRGCIEWQRLGLQPAAEVVGATDSYRTEMDAVAGFLEDCCVLEAGAYVTMASLYKAYSAWCDVTREKALTKREMNSRMTERGYDKRRGSGGVWQWCGLGIKDETTQADLFSDNDMLN